MSLIGDLRIAAYLKRIARAEERAADALEELRQIERARWQKETRTTGRAIKQTEIASFDVDEANARYRKELSAAEYGATLEDVTVEDLDARPAPQK